MVVCKLLGGTSAEAPDAARSASAITHITSDDPPFLLGHGTADPTVPYEQTQTFMAALKSAKAPVTIIAFEKGGHIGGVRSSRTVGAFFRQASPRTVSRSEF